MSRFYCTGCQKTMVEKRDTNRRIVECDCGGVAQKILAVPNIGRLIKQDIYDERIIDGTEHRDIDSFRKADVDGVKEDLKHRMIRKEADLAVGDNVRPNKNVADRIADSIERFSNTELDDEERSDIRQMEGTISRANIRRDTYVIAWDEDAKALSTKYNGDRFDFFDLDGDWVSWDLNRVITDRDVGSVGSVEVSDKKGKSDTPEVAIGG